MGFKDRIKSLAGPAGMAIGGLLGGPAGMAIGGALGNAVGGAGGGGGGGGNVGGAILQGYDLYRSEKDRKKYLKNLAEASEIEKKSFDKLSNSTREGFSRSLTYGKKARDSRVRQVNKGYDAVAEGLQKGAKATLENNRSSRSAQRTQTNDGYNKAIATQIAGAKKSEALFERDRNKFTADEKKTHDYLLQKERESAGILREQANKSTALYDPYVTSGAKTTDLLTTLLTDPNANADKYLQTAGYKFAFDQGNRALDSSAAARGGLLSGASIKAAQKFGAGLANQNYNTFINQLATASGQGLNAVNSVADINSNLANSLVNNTKDYSRLQGDNDQFYNNLIANGTALNAQHNRDFTNSVSSARLNRGVALSDIDKEYYNIRGNTLSAHHTAQGNNTLNRNTINADIDGKYYDDLGQSWLDYNQRQGQIRLNQDNTVAGNIRADARERHQNAQANQAGRSAVINTAVGGASGLNGLVGDIINAGAGLLSGGGGASPAAAPVNFANPYNMAL